MSQGWEIKSLGEIADVEYGYTDKASEEGDYRYVRITDIDSNGELISTDKKYLKKSKEADGFLICDNDLLMARTGATFAKVLLYEDFEPSVFASYLIRIKFKEKIENKLYWYFTKTKSYWDQANSLASGAAQPHFNGAAVKQVIFTYPKSLPEQQRIVAILDEAFAAIAKAKANAEQNFKNAKELFESYLNGVFENKGDGWEERRLGENDLIEIIDGDRGKNYPTQKDFMDEGHCLFMNTKNVRPNGFEFNTTVFINEDKDNAMGKGKLKRNDVVMTTRGTIGNLGVYDNDVEYDHIRINSGMLIFRPNLKQITPEYLFEILRSGIIKEQIKKQVTGAAQPQLPIKTLVNFVFPVPKSLKQQQTIVKKLDALSSETKKLEAIYQQKINDLEELKKSVLEKAFRGELSSFASTSVSVAKVIPLQKIEGISATDLQAGITAIALQKHSELNKLDSFGHVKAEKIVHLAEYVLNIDLERNPMKDAAGPNDFPHAKKVESRAAKAGFYTVTKREADQETTYLFTQGPSINSLIQKTQHYLGERNEALTQLLKLIVPMKTQQAEIVATVYAAWNNLIINGIEIKR